MTDFFGGVASVEVQASDAKLPFRSAPAPWRTARRAMTIGQDPSVVKFGQIGSKSRPVSPGGWKKPLEKRDVVGQAWLGGLVVLGAIGYASWISSKQSRTKL